ncbi:MAG: ribonuclease HII [Spirochaetota bacterium]
MKKPHEDVDLFAYERALTADGRGRIAGIDEVGRGALAGPLVAAGVILDLDNVPLGINDSKKLSARKRETLYDAIIASARAYKIVFTPIETIDDVNILNATIMTMQAIVREMDPPPDHLLIDAVHLPAVSTPQTSIIKGDAKSVSIAAASILAKVARDRHMEELSKGFPGYGWEKNKGYGAKDHIEAIHTKGVTEHHRRTFAPVSGILETNTLF